MSLTIKQVKKVVVLIDALESDVRKSHKPYREDGFKIDIHKLFLVFKDAVMDIVAEDKHDK